MLSLLLVLAVTGEQQRPPSALVNHPQTVTAIVVQGSIKKRDK